jgi:SulP family sulfate permease
MMSLNLWKEKFKNSTIIQDMTGGFSAMLVLLPSSIAYGLIAFNGLGEAYKGKAVIAGITGTIILSIIAPLFGKTPKLVTGPCAPAAAVLSAFVVETLKKGNDNYPVEIIPIFLILTAFFSGFIQVLIGKFGGGKLVKFIPYPVIAGYLSGVGILIISGQVKKFTGIPQNENILNSLFNLNTGNIINITIGFFTAITMIEAIRYSKKIPPAIIALAVGVITFFSFSYFYPELLILDKNPYIVGYISLAFSDLSKSVATDWSSILHLNPSYLAVIVVPAITLSLLLSIDTLKTCLVVDAMTQTRHNSNQEFIGQGIGNMCSAIFGGMPGGAALGPTLVNVNSGAKTRFSGFFVGVFAILFLLVFPQIISWTPVAALAGVLMVLGFRMIDWKSFKLLKHKSTTIDFIVIIVVVISAIFYDLVTAAGTGVTMAIIMFIKGQINSTVIRRKYFGNETFSKKKRLPSEIDILDKHGKETIVLELQGQLFFGTTDQLFNVLEPFLSSCKYIILDMARVQSIDFTAAHMLEQIHDRLHKNGGWMILSSVPIDLPTGLNAKNYIRHLGVRESETLLFFEDIEASIEHVEDRVLEKYFGMEEENKPLELTEFEFFEGANPEAIKKIEKHLEMKEFSKGDFIFRKDEVGDEIYFIRKGEVKIVLPLENKTNHLLTIFSQGDFFGDMAFLNTGNRSADAIADTPTYLYLLSRKEFDKISNKFPELGSLFYEKLAFNMAHRLRLLHVELNALRKG